MAFLQHTLPGLHQLHEWPADIILPYGSDSEDDTDTRLGSLKNYHWATTLAVEGKEHPFVQYQEGSSWSDLIPGYGSIANSDAHYHNIEHGRARDSYVDQWDRPHIGTDAYTPFHHAFAQTLSKAIPAGAELFVDYGDDYFAGRESPPYEGVPVSYSYTEASALMESFIDHTFQHYIDNHECPECDHADEVVDLQSLWESTLENVPSPRTLSVLPKDVNVVLDSMGTAFPLGINQRPLEYIKSEGMCLDRVRVGASQIYEAGRGIFAKSKISQGALITPVPVAAINRTLQLLDDSMQRLIVNYCFGHMNSSLLFYPYTTTAMLVNHSSSKANSKLKLSSKIDTSLLDKTPSEILDIKFSLGVVFEIVATRDIERGEEILMDYGIDWQRAWDSHLEAWKPFVSEFDPSTRPLTSEPWESTVEAILKQTPQQRRTTKIDTGCYYDPDWSQPSISSSALNLLEALPWRWHKILSGSVGGLYPCLLLEQTDETYTALVFLDYDPKTREDFDESGNEDVVGDSEETTKRRVQLVQGIPLEAIRSITQEWLDEYPVDHIKELKSRVPLPFRHFIGVDDSNVFLNIWQDLKSE